MEKKIKFVFEDDQADPNSSMQAFNKLVDDEKVSAILGPVTSGATLAVAPNATSKTNSNDYSNSYRTNNN